MYPEDACENGKPLVLLVDDEPCITEVLAYVLAQEGYRTVSAVSLYEVTNLLRTEAPRIAVIDVALGEDSGTDVARLLAERSEEVLAVFTSGLSREMLDLEDLPSNVRVGFVQKAFSPRQIVAAVKKLHRETACAGVSTLPGVPTLGRDGRAL